MRLYKNLISFRIEEVCRCTAIALGFRAAIQVVVRGQLGLIN